ncbi:MAG: Allophanate hydrolase subunit 1, partial [Modestobacter sp.]|nr:Allophanate hydrolase subunit 1 [Modestobacter sp.]
MRLLPSGDAGLLVELDDLDAVLALHRTLAAEPPAGVLDVVPASRTVLLVLDPALTTVGAVATAVGRTRPTAADRTGGELVELPVVYDG